MEWKLAEEQQAYQDTLRGWLVDAAGPERVREWWDAGESRTFTDRFEADGWVGVGIAEELGGQGGGVVELAVTAEELGRAAVPSAAWLASVLCVPALQASPDRSVGWMLPAEIVPGASSPAVRMDAQGRLTGTARRVLAGGEAAAFVVAAEGGLRLVESGADGVTVTPRHLLDRSRSVADVTLADAPSEPVGTNASAALARAADLAGVLVAADALGAMERMLELSVEYAGQRRQFGVPIGSFQAVKHAAARIEVAVEAARSAVYFAAASVDAEMEQCDLHAAAVKAQVTAEAARSADTALTMHGAVGYTWEHDLHFLYKRARLDEHLMGAPAVWNERIAAGLALA